MAKARKSNILIIDDEPDIRSLVQDILAAPNLKFSQAENGREALSMLDKSEFDLIISDYNMPKLNGLELMKCLREEKKDSIVIWLTGRGSAELYKEALTYGAYSCLEKPIDTDDLIRTVDAALKLNKDWASKQRDNYFVTSQFVEIPLLLKKGMISPIKKISRQQRRSVNEYITSLIEKDLFKKSMLPNANEEEEQSPRP